MKSLIVLAVAVVALLAFYRLQKKDSGGPASQSGLTQGATDQKLAAATNPPSPQPSTRMKQPEFVAPIDPEKYFSRELLEGGNPVYRARVTRHLALRHYNNSPAKDTPECQQIVSLLSEEGIGPEGAFEAYVAADDYWRAKRRAGDAHAHTIRQTAAQRLRVKYGITNETFFEGLFRVEPKVLFGQRDLNLPGEGELLLE